MRRMISAAVLAAILITGCDPGGMSSTEIERAAIERAREKLELPSNAPLEATVWVGQPQDDGSITFCGTVSGRGGGPQVRPQRFAASAEPFRWLVFEDAHDRFISNQQDKFVEWSNLCGASEKAT